MSTRNFYALLVGINDYPIPAHRLYGCHNDVYAAKAFLENRVNRNQFNLQVRMLLSAEATRSNISRHFEQFLGQARENDIAFFYYSGHGSQEPAGSFFSHLEPDGKNETLVCWDSRIEDGMDLADKELATLIQLVAQRNPHIVTLLDCCHSGSGTREIGDEAPADFLVRQSPAYDKVRSLDSYILPRNLSTDRSILSSQGTQTLIIPEGRHVAMTAAESFELAKETTLGGNRRGVFSFSIMELLQTSTGDVTYGDIMRRVRTLVANRTFDQTPTLYAPNPADLNRKVLDGSWVGASDYFALTFDQDKGWIIDGGSIHGVIKGSWGGSNTVLAVFPFDTPASAMENLSRSIGRVEVTEVSPGESKIQPIGSLFLNQGQSYRCRILSLPVEPNKVFFFGDAQGIRLLRDQLARGGTVASYVQEVPRLDQADYKLLALRNMYIISRAADGMWDQAIINRDGIDYRPLVEQVRGYTPQSADTVLGYMEHITQWERTLELRNPNSRIASSFLRVELFHPDRDERIPAGWNGYKFSYVHNSPSRPAFRIRLTNAGSQKLFCSLLYMSSTFGVEPNLLPEGGLWLEPGQSAWALNGDPVEAEISDNFAAFGLKRVNEVLKVIASTEKFHPQLLHMAALGEPQPQLRSLDELNTTDLALGQTQDRALTPRTRASGSFADWNTTEVTLVVERN